MTDCHWKVAAADIFFLTHFTKLPSFFIVQYTPESMYNILRILCTLYSGILNYPEN
jgi:hypothetical protein